MPLLTTWKCVPLLWAGRKGPANDTRYFALGMHLSPTLQSPFSFHLGCGYDARKNKKKQKKTMDFDRTPATTCRCCGTAIIDARGRRKISSNTVRPLVPILIRLLGEHTVEKRPILSFCFLVAGLKAFTYSRSPVRMLCRGSVARNGQKHVKNKRNTTICRSP